MKVLMMGPPGCGKGTQGVALARHLGVPHIAAGDLLRAEVAKGTHVGRYVAELMQRGELVPDLAIISLLMPEVLRSTEHDGYVLDGYPRSVPQAELTRDLVDQSNLDADVVIFLDVPTAELVERILARAAVEGRDDDTPEVVGNRLSVYEQVTKPLIEYYRARGVLHVIDASGPIDEVTARVTAVANAARVITAPSSPA